MRKISVWVLGIVLGSILAYTGWNGLMTPNFLMGETNVVTGKIIDVYPSKEVQSYSRRIKYVYAVNGNYYLDFKKLGTKDKKQSIGNGLQITYSINNPQKHRIDKHLNNYRNSKGVKYYANIEKGYIRMDLINGIFKYQEYIDGGEIVKNFVGEYTLVEDSILVEHYSFDTNLQTNNNPQFFVVDDYYGSSLIESGTKRIFKKN